MKIQFEEDFIYVVNGQNATLVLKNCNQECIFCPACKLKNFQNYTLLNSSFDSGVKNLIIYGNINSSYMETFFQRVLRENPNIAITVVGCKCELSQPVPLVYKHIIHPTLHNELTYMTDGFFLPAIGDFLELKVFAMKMQNTYQNTPITLGILDSGESSAEFWSKDKIEDLQKQIDAKDFRI